MSALLDIATKLQDLGFGSLSSNPKTIQVDHMGMAPDNVITVYGSGGPPPTRVMPGTVAFEYVDIQIQVRNNSPSAAETTCYNIYVQLPPALNKVTINSHEYNYCEIPSFPEKMKVDESERTVYYTEFRVWREPE